MEDPRKRDWVSFYRPIFVNHLNVNATFLSLLQRVVASTEEAGTLAKCNSNRRERAVTKFLEKLSKVQNKDGIFPEVCYALKHSEQDHVEEMIRNGQNAPSELSLRNKHLLRQYQREITKRVNPSEILPHLTCLTAEENSEINCCKDNHGDERGALKMLSYLVLKADDMLDQLLTGLRDTGHGDVADQLKDEMAKEMRRINARRQPDPDVEEYYEEWKGVDDLECCTDVDEMTKQVAGLEISSNSCESALKPEEEGAFGVTYTTQPPTDDNLDFFDASESWEVYEEENADNEDIEKAQIHSQNNQKGLASRCNKSNAGSGAGSHSLPKPQRKSPVQLENEQTVKSNSEKQRKLQKQNTLPDVQGTTRVELRRNCSVKMPTIRRHPDQLKRLSLSGNGYTVDTVNANEKPSTNTQTIKTSDMKSVTTGFDDTTKSVERNSSAARFNNSELTPEKLQTLEMSFDKLQIPVVSLDKVQTPQRSPDKLQAPTPKVISGNVIDVKTKWASDCCKECTKSGFCKIDEVSKHLICGSCGTCYQDKPGLVQRLFAEVTLQTVDQASVQKTCYNRELLKFFKKNGDKFTDFRSKDRLILT